MKVFILIFLLSSTALAKICNDRGSCWNIGDRPLSDPVCNTKGKCWNLRTFKKMKGDICHSIGKSRLELRELNENLNRSQGFNLKDNYNLINCHKNSRPLSISKTVIMRDMWPGHLTPLLCYAGESTNKKDLAWVKDGIRKRRYHWKKYIKTYQFAIKNKIQFNKFCNGVYPFDGKFRIRK